MENINKLKDKQAVMMMLKLEKMRWDLKREENYGWKNTLLRVRKQARKSKFIPRGEEFHNKISQKPQWKNEKRKTVIFGFIAMLCTATA